MINDIPLSAITPLRLQKVMDYFYRVKKLKESTVRNYSGILRRMLQQAVDEGYIPYNPAAHLRVPRLIVNHHAIGCICMGFED